MALKLACPSCHEVAFYDDEWAGKPVTCGKCAQVFRVPQLKPTEPALPAPSPQVEVRPLEVRQVPLSFAPSEPLQVHAAPVADEAPSRPERRLGDRERELGRPAPRRRDDRNRDDRNGDDRSLEHPRRRLASPTGGSWLAGVSALAFIMLVFVGTALWFMLRDHRPPPRGAGFGQKQFFPGGQPAPPPMPPMPPQAMLPQVEGPPPRVPVIPLENEQPIAIKLENGVARAKERIAENDPFDVEPNPQGNWMRPSHPQGGCHRKVFLIELEANRNYKFEMKADPPRVRNNFFPGQIDPWLRIEDPQGKMIAENDDIMQAVELDSRLTTRLPAKAVYRVVATTCNRNQRGGFILLITDEDRGIPVAAKPLPERPLPRPADAKNALKTQQQSKRQVEMTHVELEGAKLLGELHWSKDAKAVFVLDAAGALRRISVPGFVEEKHLALGSPPSSLALSSAGLVVSFEKQEELWVIDPETLAVLRRISAPGVTRATAAPASPLAFASVRVKNRGAGVGVIVIDALKGVPLRRYDFPLKHLTASPDGKFLFGEGGIESLQRFRIQGDELVLEEESPRLASRAQGVAVSPDSRYVCLPSASGNYTDSVKPPPRPFSTFVYAVGNFRQPAAIIHSGPSPRTVGFHAKNEHLYAHNEQSEFLVFNFKGERLHEVNLPSTDRLLSEPRQFLSHPSGHGVLIRADSDLYWVELPREEME